MNPASRCPVCNSHLLTRFLSRERVPVHQNLNPNKQGKYVPGTGHESVGYEKIAKRGIKSAILMNENYRQENLAWLR